MTDREFLERTERIIQNTRECCDHLLCLVDHYGQDIAFQQLMQTSAIKYTREIMVRMLLAAKGATDAEIFALAIAIDKLPSTSLD